MGTKADKTGMSRKQIKAAEKLANPDFDGTITQLCEEVGVARSTFYDWLGKEDFRAYVDSLIDRYTDSELSRVWKALMRQIDGGDIQAIKLYFELKGRYKQGVGRDVQSQPQNNLFDAITRSTEALRYAVSDVQQEAASCDAVVGASGDEGA